MANTGIVHGGDILVYHNVGDEETPDWQPFAHQKSNTINHGDTEVREVSSKNMGTTPLVKFGKDGISTINLTALRAYDAYSYFDMVTMKKERTVLQVKIAGRPSTDTNIFEVNEASGDSYLQCDAVITSLSCENPEDQEATVQATLTVNGDFEELTVA